MGRRHIFTVLLSFLGLGAIATSSRGRAADERKRVREHRLLLLVFLPAAAVAGAGAWLFVSGFLVADAQAPFWNALVVGTAAIAIGTGWALAAREQGLLGWTAAVLGVWLVASPWINGYADGDGAHWNALVLGVVIAGAGVVGGLLDALAARRRR